MEFERGIFRMHERALQNRAAKPLARCTFQCCWIMAALAITTFITTHVSYVSRNHILKPAMEQQLLSHKPAEY